MIISLLGCLHLSTVTNRHTRSVMLGLRSEPRLLLLECLGVPGQILPCWSFSLLGCSPPKSYQSLPTYCMLVFQHVRASMSAGSRCVSELKPHRVILYEKARYVKTVNGRQSQKTVGAGEHRYRLRWIWGR